MSSIPISSSKTWLIKTTVVEDTTLAQPTDYNSATHLHTAFKLDTVSFAITSWYDDMDADLNTEPVGYGGPRGYKKE